MTQLSRYSLLNKIGSSTLGTVYKALDTATGTHVALKIVQLGLLDDVSSREMDARLQREFETASRLIHSGIVRVYEIRRDEKVALIATELVDGPSVTSYLQAPGGADLSQTVAATAQILEALEFAHTQSVIHRDLQPSNILVSHGTHIKITDFGMADLAARNRDETGMLIGETQYMAPEQFVGGVVNQRCDIHAVGTILYELLTGTCPFAAEAGAFAAMTRVLEHVPPPPSQLRSGLSPAFDRVLAGALAKSPAQRYPSARRFREELCNAYFALTRRQPPVALNPVPVPPSAPAASAPRTTMLQARPSRWSLEGATSEPPASTSVQDSVDASRQEVESPVAPEPPASAPVPPPAPPESPMFVRPAIPLTDASIQHGGRVLARFVGPIALVLSRRAAQDARDERGYFELLAAHLSDPGERSQFFRDLRRQS
jgi:serine/threonine-protein kinase